MTSSSWVVPLPWSRPPLSANDRPGNVHARARQVKAAREAAGWAAAGARLPRRARTCRVQLHYRPRDNRRRDTDNLYPTLKAVCDGLVDYGLVPDDTPRWMGKPEPIIHRAERGQPGALWLSVSGTWTPRSVVQ